MKANLTQLAVPVGVVGVGRIGTSVVRRLQPFGFRLLGYDPYLPRGHDRALGYQRCDSLDELLDATSGAIPEPVRAALEAAQRIDFDRERRRARTIIRGASAAAAPTCAIPLSVADSAALFPVQMSMLAGISAAYGVPTPAGRLAGAFGSIIAASGAATLGRYVAGSLLKVIPGVGSLTGYLIKASVASSITLAMGYGWMSVNERLVRMTEEEAQRFLSTDAVARAFVDAFTHAWRDRSRLRRELEPPAEEPAGNRLPDP